MSSGVRSTFGAWKKDSVVECKGCHTWQHKNHNSCPKCGTSLVERCVDRRAEYMRTIDTSSQNALDLRKERVRSLALLCVEKYYDPYLDLLPPASVMSRKLFEDVGEKLSSSTIIKHLKLMGWVKVDNNSGWRKLE